MYGAFETNSLVVDGSVYHAQVGANTGDWDYTLDDKRVVKIARLRLLSDPGSPLWDVSYCHGQLADGTIVRMQLPVHQFTKGKLYSELVEMCKGAGRYGKGMGIFDAISKCQ